MAPNSTTVTLSNGESLRVSVTRSVRRKRTIAFRLLPDGSIAVRAPRHTAAEDIAALLRAREPWLLRARTRLTAAIPLGDRTTLPYLGVERPIAGGLPSVEPQTVPSIGSANPQAAAHLPTLQRWYRTAAHPYLANRVKALAPTVGVEPARVLVSRQKAAWGSCSRDGTLRLSFRLMMLRPELIDFVVVHELCHLLHHNHSPAFWSEVERCLPEFRELRAELRTINAGLPL